MTSPAAWFVLFLVVVLVLYFVVENARKGRMLSVYGDTNEGRAIANKQIFVGMTHWQLEDSWGSPKSKSSRVLRTKTKETWIYDSSNHVYLEDNVVVGWKQKR